jgi:hypothetical protein
MPMQLPYSKCFRVGRCDLGFSRDDGAQVEGNEGDPDGGRSLRKVALEVLVRAEWLPSAGTGQFGFCAPRRSDN